MEKELHTKPFLKWAGGKYGSLNPILNHFPAATRLIEPFAGSGAIFANTAYPHYLLAEANTDLINLYSQLKKKGNDFIAYCERYFTLENNTSPAYYQLREKFNTLDPYQMERAAIFLYLNRHGYNGLCRYNQKGGYNVPFGRYKKPYFPRKELNHFWKKSQNADFILSDFKDTFIRAQKGDVVYCDPPYVPLSHTASFVSYTQKKFKEEEQLILAKLAKETASRGIPVIISNHDTALTREYYQGARIINFPVKRYINCKANMRHSVIELLAIFQ